MPTRPKPQTPSTAVAFHYVQTDSFVALLHKLGASLLVILPVIVLFFLTQRTFIQGIATTGIK